MSVIVFFVCLDHAVGDGVGISGMISFIDIDTIVLLFSRLWSWVSAHLFGCEISMRISIMILAHRLSI